MEVFLKMTGRIILLWTILACGSMALAHAQSTQSDESSSYGIDLSGMGWLTNRQLSRTLELFLPSGRPDQPLQRHHIEDAAFLLQGESETRGYLNATFEFTLSRNNGLPWNGSWNKGTFDTPLPPTGESFQHMQIKILKGHLYYFAQLEIKGVEILPDDPKLFFHTTGFLFNTEGNRYYSAARKTSGIRSIITELNRLGYLDAKVVQESETIDPATGAVRLSLKFERGPRYWIRNIEVRTPNDSSTETLSDTPFSTIFLQDYLQDLRTPYYSRGYPDVETSLLNRETVKNGDEVQVDLVIEVDPGDRVTTGEIRFEGIANTRESFLRRRVPLQTGETFDILETEKARQRIAGLGVFEVVEIYYPERVNDQQDVLYRTTMRPNYDASLLVGYGSYEAVRGGVELVHRNVLGRAHQGKLKLVQSMKSTRGDYLYTIPEVWGESGNMFTRIKYLDREEVTFRRHELGASIGTDYYWSGLGILSSLQYSYETVKSRNQRFIEAPGVSSANVGSLQLTLSHDRLNNVLYPTRGHKIYLSYEYASKALGGNVDFQRVESGISYHTPLFGGLLFHGSVRHGIAWSQSATRTELPVTRRFFPGGENSIRGYKEGQASPLGPGGGEIGAEVYLLFNLELEQPILPDLSLVLFTDILGSSARYQEWPGNEWLTTIGIGLRYRTIIGPVRLEYGHNLNPHREKDHGALHFSIGFPF